jgi:hypothetical protein
MAPNVTAILQRFTAAAYCQARAQPRCAPFPLLEHSGSTGYVSGPSKGWSIHTVFITGSNDLPVIGHMAIWPYFTSSAGVYSRPQGMSAGSIPCSASA